MQFYTVQSRISDNLDWYHDFLFLCLSHCHCFCWFANTNLCVLEERRALCVGNNDLFYLLLLFPPLPSPLPLAFPMVIVSSLCAIVFRHLFFLLCLCVFYLLSYVGSFGSHSWAYGLTREKLAHFWTQRQACSVCVCALILMNLSSVGFFFCIWGYYESASTLYIYKPHWFRSWRMEQCTMNACLETMGRCAGSGPIWLSSWLWEILLS